MTVTANPQTKVYGQQDPSFTYTAQTFINSTVDGITINDNAGNSLTGNLNRQLLTQADENVGTHAILQGSLSSSNYAISYVGDNLTITKAPLTVTANPQTKVYGQQDPSFTYTAQTFINSTVDGIAISDNAGNSLTGNLNRQFLTQADENVGTHAILQGSLSSSNYAISYVGDNLTITKAPLTVTANPQTKVYGQQDPSFTYTAQTFINSTVDGITINDNAGNSLTGNLNRQLLTQADENVGTHAILQGSLSSSNYAISYVGDNLTITKAPLTVTANPQTKVYGQQDPSFTYTAQTFINSTVDGITINDNAGNSLTGNLNRQLLTQADENVGTHAIVQGSLSSSNYAISYVGDNLTITKAPLTVTANPQTKVYGQQDPSFTYTAQTFINSTVDGIAISDNAGNSLTGNLNRQLLTQADENVGTHAILQGSLSSSNYAITYVGDNLTITKAPLTVTANPQTKVYGQQDPSFTYTAQTFINSTVDGITINDNAGNSLTGNLNRQLLTQADENVGTHAILQGSLSSSNYAISYVGDNLTITKAPLTVTANPQTKVYGQQDPSFTYTAQTFINSIVDGITINDNAGNSLTGNLNRQLLTQADENVGTHAILQGSLSSSNYAISYVGDNLTITKAPLTVTANPQTKVYGQQDPSFTYTAQTFINSTVDGITINDNAGNSLTGNLNRQLLTQADENVGTHAILQGSLSSSNYAISYVGDNLTITKAPLTVTANPQTKVYGQQDPSFTYTAQTFINGVVDGITINDNAGNSLTGNLNRQFLTKLMKMLGHMQSYKAA